MTTFNTYSLDEPHEKECILQMHKDVLQRSGSQVEELLKGKNPVAALASLAYLLEKGMVRREKELGFDNLKNDERIFPVFGTVFKK